MSKKSQAYLDLRSEVPEKEALAALGHTSKTLRNWRLREPGFRAAEEEAISKHHDKLKKIANRNTMEALPDAIAELITQMRGEDRAEDRRKAAEDIIKLCGLVTDKVSVDLKQITVDIDD